MDGLAGIAARGLSKFLVFRFAGGAPAIRLLLMILDSTGILAMFELESTILLAEPKILFFTI